MKRQDHLANSVKQSIEQYFNDLNGEQPLKLHKLFMSEVEKPFLQVVMQQVEGNQSRAAALLGINRNTLRKKLQTYHLD